MIQEILSHVEAGGNLEMDQMASVIGEVFQGGCDEQQVARLLLALHAKGETVAEVAGAAWAMRRRMTPIRTSRRGVLDTCGTGGDGSRTFNISTAAALVTAAAGVPVAKHGNRRASSRSGSADVLAALGVNVEAGVPLVEACLDELGICFCFAPLLHGAMRQVAAVRSRLGVPTIFNILGPLVNPASAPFQLLGVGRQPQQSLLAEALLLLGTERVLVIHGCDGLDEVTLRGPTHVVEATCGGLRDFDVAPEDFGLSRSDLTAVEIDGPHQSAEMIREVLADRPGPARDIVVANAAAALWTVGRHESLAVCAEHARDAIRSGAAAGLLARLAEKTHPKE
jgi:anthranilate phosphoribosyltransferase